MLSRCIRKVAFSPPSRHMIHLTASVHREFKPAQHSQSNHGSIIIGTGAGVWGRTTNYWTIFMAFEANPWQWCVLCNS